MKMQFTQYYLDWTSFVLIYIIVQSILYFFNENITIVSKTIAKRNPDAL